MSAEGNSQREIAEKLGISRNTVSTYLKKEDFSPAPPTRGGGRSPLMEPHADVVAGWLESDRDRPRNSNSNSE